MPKKIAYNLQYRPKSYWERTDPLQAVLCEISGTARRRMITDFWNMGMFGKLEPGILKPDRDGGTLRHLGALNRFFMGGEFLPLRKRDEVPIARIDLDSTTYDVIELRARPLAKGRIGLRWVDEYETEFHMPCKRIDEPFSLQELIDFMAACSPDECGPMPLCYCKYAIINMDQVRSVGEEYRDFVKVSSDFYPDLFPWAVELIDSWIKSLPDRPSA